MNKQNEIIFTKKTCVRTQKTMIHLDKLDNGTWRIIYSIDVEDIANKIVLDFQEEENK
jgi:hypothetical protein